MTRCITTWSQWSGPIELQPPIMHHCDTTVDGRKPTPEMLEIQLEYCGEKQIPNVVFERLPVGTITHICRSKYICSSKFVQYRNCGKARSFMVKALSFLSFSGYEGFTQGQEWYNANAFEDISNQLLVGTTPGYHRCQKWASISTDILVGLPDNIRQLVVIFQPNQTAIASS